MPCVCFSLSFLGLREPCRCHLAQWQAADYDICSMCLLLPLPSASIPTKPHVWCDTNETQFHVKRPYLPLWMQSPTFICFLVNLVKFGFYVPSPLLERIFICLSDEDETFSSFLYTIYSQCTEWNRARENSKDVLIHQFIVLEHFLDSSRIG